MKYTFSHNRISQALASSLLVVILTGCGGGGGSDNTTPTPPVISDTTPDTFTFTDINGIALSTATESNSIEITGIDAATTVTISGGEYKIGSGIYTTAAGTVSSGQTITIKLTTSSSYATISEATLTVGGVKDTFTATTMQQPAPSLPVVQVNLDMKHSVGGVDTFDRQKYITIHASTTENGWGENDGHSRYALNSDPNLMPNFVNDYDVYFGRDTGGFGWALRNLPEDPTRPGFVDEAATKTRGNGDKWTYSNNANDKYTDAREQQSRGLDMIVGLQQFPYYPEGDKTNNPVAGIDAWTFSTTNTTDEPLGTATGHYAAQYMANFYKTSDNDIGSPMPKYFEVMNEPLYPLVTEREGEANQVPALEIFQFHNTVAKEIRKVSALDDVKIAGYTVAFPDFDKDNFQRWEERDKLFIDTSGDYMDYYSIHLYDFPCHNNKQKYRRGSNMEATMDMLESYSLLELGEVKPLIISEYGAAVHCEFNNGWTASRNTLQTKAFNAMLMGFLERPDVIEKAIPFIVVKAEWGRGAQPYGPRLMVQQFERDGTTEQTGDTHWVYSDLVKFYQLWAEVKGTRVDTWSSEADILVDAYVDNDTAYIILNNLEVENTEFDLTTLGINGNSINAINVKHLVTGANSAMTLDESTLANLDSSLTLNGESTMVIKLSFDSAITIDQTNNETKHYATSYKQSITANTTNTFNINGVTKGAQGEAVLRLGFGRNHGKSLQPTVMVNGNAVIVPNDFRGYDQNLNGNARDNFFGVIEIPMPYTYLQADNEVTVEFTDTGGFVSTAAIQAFEMSREVNRN
jgi:hypothetical protein